MGRRKVVGLVGAIVLLAGSVSEAGNEGRIEPLDGLHSPGVPPARQELPETRPLVIPNDAGRPPGGTPFGGPMPPGQLTPAPVLPFNPNRSLIPSPSPPSHSSPPLSGTGRAGR